MTKLKSIHNLFLPRSIFATFAWLLAAGLPHAASGETAGAPAGESESLSAMDWLAAEPVAGVAWGDLLAACGVLLLAGLVHFLLRRLLSRISARVPDTRALANGVPGGESERIQLRQWTALTLRAALAPLALAVWFYGLYAAINLAFHAYRDTGTWYVQTIDWLANVVFFVLFLWFLFRLIEVIDFRIRKWAENSERVWDAVFAAVAGKALRLLVPMVAVILGLPLLPVGEALAVFFRNSVSVLIVLAVSWILYGIVRAFEETVTKNFRVDVSDNLRARKLHTQVIVLRKVAVVAIAIFATASILMVFESMRQFGTSILASAGIAGIIIGFAAQRSLGTLFAGFQIAITQPIRLDDVVIVEGEWGRIEEITLTYVVVRIWDLRRLVLPIQYFIESPFQNWTRTSADILGTVFLHADYTIPVNALREELDRLLKNHPKWDGKVKGIQVTEARQQTLEIRLLMSAVDASHAWDLRCDIREKMVDFIRREYPESLPRFRAELRDTPPGQGDGLLPAPPTGSS